jgi:hypothetical protein
MDWASISVKRRGLGVQIYRHRAFLDILRVNFPVFRGFFCKSDGRRGIEYYWPLDPKPRAQIRSYLK